MPPLECDEQLGPGPKSSAPRLAFHHCYSETGVPSVEGKYQGEESTLLSTVTGSVRCLLARHESRGGESCLTPRGGQCSEVVGNSA